MASSELYTRGFWSRAIALAVRSSAVSAISPLVADRIWDLTAAPWYAALSAGVIGAVISLLSSLAAINVDTAPEPRAGRHRKPATGEGS